MSSILPREYAVKYTPLLEVIRIKKTVVKAVHRKAKESNIDHLNTLPIKGECLKFALEEKYAPLWKGFIWNLKEGTAKFLITSTIYTLPTYYNLKLWNKSVTDKGHLCGNRDSTKHTLSACQVALDQGRYMWRHDNVIKYIVDSKTKFTVHSDLSGYTTPNGGTIPTILTVTNSSLI